MKKKIRVNVTRFWRNLPKLTIVKERSMKTENQDHLNIKTKIEEVTESFMTETTSLDIPRNNQDLHTFCLGGEATDSI